MAYSQRPYLTESDKLLMADLVFRYSESHFHLADLPYRFSSWAFNDPENVRLWFDEDNQLAAWAVLQSPFWTIDYAFRPSDPALLKEILAWAGWRALVVADTEYGRPAWFIMLMECLEEQIHQVERSGFKCQADVIEDSWSKVSLQRPGQALVKAYPPPPGFIARSLAGECKVRDYVVLHQSVFETRNMTEDWRLRTLHHPAYIPDLDVVVEAPDGRLAAFCIGWMMTNVQGRRIGQIEPLGCHKDFRRYALGRVALAECLRRLASLGADTVVVETDLSRNTAFRLYESMGFEVRQKVLVFRKDDEPG